MADVIFPVHVRIGSGSENQIGEVTAASVEEASPQLAALLRVAADELDRLGQDGVRDGD